MNVPHVSPAPGRVASWTAGLLLAASMPSWGAGMWITETGGSDMAMAGAGRAAMSLDAASQSANPATLGGLPGDSITAALMPLDLALEFRGSDTSPAKASNQAGVQVLWSLHAAHRVGRITYGLGAYSYMALSFDLGDTWAGRRVIEEAGMTTFNVAPAVAFAATDRLTLGVSVVAQRAEYEAALAVSNDAAYYGPPAGLPDGRIRLDGGSWGLGGQLGVQYQATDDLQLGMAWTLPVDHSADGDTKATDVHPVLATLLPPDGTVTLKFTVPQQLLLGIAYQTTPQTTLSLGLAWQDWSAFGNSTLTLPGQVSAMFPEGLSDTWGASIGVRGALGEHWHAAAGIDYESDPSKHGSVPVYFPVAEQWRIALGAERSISETCRLRLSLSVVDEGRVTVVQTSHPLPLPGIEPLTGSYETARIYMLGIAADFRL